MWQRFLDRFVPLMEEAPSRLDRCDGVGRPIDAAAPTGAMGATEALELHE